METKWTTEIKRDGMWPTVWGWKVTCQVFEHDDFWNEPRENFGLREWRFGETFTRERALKKAIKARLSIEQENLRIEEH